MKTITQTLNESFINEKTSSIRAFKVYEKNIPEWAKGLESYNLRYGYDTLKKLAEYYGYTGSLYVNNNELTEYVYKMSKMYLNEYIDLKEVPVGVLAAFVEDFFKNQTKKIKDTKLIQFANYLNNEIHWTAPK